MKERTRNVLLWVGSVLLALLFFAAGASKLLMAEESAQEFEGWGYPAWFHWVIGVVEVAGALLLLWPRTAFYGGALLAVDMAGAVMTHLANAEWTMWPLPLALGIVAILVAWGRMPERLAGRLGRAAPERSPQD